MQLIDEPPSLSDEPALTDNDRQIEYLQACLFRRDHLCVRLYQEIEDLRSAIDRKDRQIAAMENRLARVDN